MPNRENFNGNVPWNWKVVTASATAIANGPISAIRANVAGTITVTTVYGDSVVMNFAAGETRLVAATHVTAATATGIEVAFL
jgi:hypothetical protein